MHKRLSKGVATAVTILTCLSIPGLVGASTWSWAPFRYTRHASYNTLSAKTSATTTQTGIDSALLSMLNKERSSRGLRPLQVDPGAASAARAKSQEMASKKYFSHTSPTYGSPAQLLKRFGVSYTMWAENIGKGSDAARLHAMWMASAGHRANMLNPAFTHVGIEAVSASGGYTATQLFLAK